VIEWVDPETDWTQPEPRRAVQLLAEAYGHCDQVRKLARSVGLDDGNAPGHNASANAVWISVLGDASRLGRVLDLVAEVLHDPAVKVFHAPLIDLLGDHLPSVTLKLAARGEALPGTMLEKLESRRVEPPDEPVEGLDALTSTSLGFENSAAELQAITDQMRRTAQIRRGGHPIGTGVLIGDDLLLTAAHVLDSKCWPPAERLGLVAVFDYISAPWSSHAETGSAVEVIDFIEASLPTSAEVAGDSTRDWSASDTELDFAVVRLKDPVGRQPMPGPRGHYRLDRTAYDFERTSILRIVQHPFGQMQTTSFVKKPPKINPQGTRIRYESNTLKGSSGSPIIDLRGRLVAIHHYSTSTKCQAVPFQVISKILREGRHAALFSESADVHPPVSDPPATTDPLNVGVIAGRPFIDRDPLRDTLRKMAKRNGPRFVAVGGDEDSGISHTYALVSYLAAESKSCRELKLAAGGDLRAHRIDLRRYAPGQRQVEAAREVLALLGIEEFDEFAQGARLLRRVKTELTRSLRNTHQQWWLFIDSLDDHVVAVQDGTAELIKTIIELAEDQQYPLRVLIGGRQSWDLTVHVPEMPIFDEDYAQRVRPEHAVEWVRARAEDLERTITLTDDGIVAEFNALMSERMALRGTPASEMDAKIHAFATSGLLPRDVAPLLEKLVTRVSKEPPDDAH
jgi:hypothetical protein